MLALQSRPERIHPTGLTVATQGEQTQQKKDDRSNRKSTAISVDKDLARMVGVITQHRGITQAALISPVIREFVEAQYALVSAEIQKEVKAKERKNPK